MRSPAHVLLWIIFIACLLSAVMLFLAGVNVGSCVINRTNTPAVTTDSDVVQSTGSSNVVTLPEDNYPY